MLIDTEKETMKNASQGYSVIQGSKHLPPASFQERRIGYHSRKTPENSTVISKNNLVIREPMLLKFYPLMSQLVFIQYLLFVA